jgi:hypothetical protein
MSQLSPLGKKALGKCAAFLVPVFLACGGAEKETPPPLSFDIPPEQFEDNDPCTPPAKGCGCSEPFAETDCGTITRHSADYITCSYGVITCGEDLEWGECIGDEISVLPIPDTGATK